MKKTGTIKRLAKYFSHSKVSLFFVAVFALFSTAFSVFAPKLIGGVTTELFNYSGEIAKNGKADFPTETIVLLLSSVVVLYIVANVFLLIQNFVMSKVVSNAIRDIRQDIDDKMHIIKLDYYDTHPNGEILSTITNDIESIYNGLCVNLSEILRQILKAIGLIVMMFVVNWVLALIALISVPVTLLVTKGMIAFSTKKYNEQQELLGKLNGVIEENYNGQNVIQAFNYQDRAINDFEAKNEELQKCARSAEGSAATVAPLTRVVNNISYVLIAFFGCLFVIGGGGLAIGDVQAILQYTKELSEPFSTISGMVGALGGAVAAANRIFSLIDAEEEIPDPENGVVPNTNEGAVEFRHVKFGYQPDRLLMTDVNIKVKPGQKVAVVGPTGAGKTTLINLLMRFYEINGGDIFVDGVNTKEMTRKELRNRFSMVLQDTWLFEGTIMDNLKYGNENVTDDLVLEASKAAKTDNFIKTLPNGYNMVLDQGAENISQGERQMLTIVRAMAVNPEIMILDEATSNVDTHTEVMIQEAMAKLMKGRTSFVIAHRLSTIKDSDVILYMEQGDIKEFGNHDELMALNGKYAALYNSQFA